MEKINLRLMNGHLLYDDREKLFELFDAMEEKGLIESVGYGDFTRAYREIETEFFLPLYIEETTMPKQLDIDIDLIKKYAEKVGVKVNFVHIS